MKKITLNREQIFQGNLLLVNEHNPLQHTVPSEQIRPLERPAVQPAASGSPAGRQPVCMERKAAMVLETLLAAIGSGSALVSVSGFRSHKEQEAIYHSSLAEHGADFTRSYVALPGCSEHETGLAIDLALNQEPIDFLCPCFPKDGICGRFREKAAAYGFIERYQEGKETLTGIAPEPWHFRYVGIPHASVMAFHNFCLEEYLDYLTSFPYEGKHLEIRVENKAFELFYVEAETDITEITLPGYLPVQVSGDNQKGFIFTLWR